MVAGIIYRITDSSDLIGLNVTHILMLNDDVTTKAMRSDRVKKVKPNRNKRKLFKDLTEPNRPYSYIRSNRTKQ